MEINIVDSNYIANHWISKISRWILIGYGILLVIITGTKISLITDNQSYIQLFSGIIFLLASVLSLLNLFIYNKIGVLIYIDENEFILSIGDLKDNKLRINEVKFIEETQKGIWKVTFANITHELKLNSNEKTRFIKLLNSMNIRVINSNRSMHLLDKIKGKLSFK